MATQWRALEHKCHQNCPIERSQIWWDFRKPGFESQPKTKIAEWPQANYLLSRIIQKCVCIYIYICQTVFPQFWARHNQGWEEWERGPCMSEVWLCLRELRFKGRDKLDKSFLVQSRDIQMLTSTLWILNKETVFPLGSRRKMFQIGFKIVHKKRLEVTKYTFVSGASEQMMSNEV